MDFLSWDNFFHVFFAFSLGLLVGLAGLMWQYYPSWVEKRMDRDEARDLLKKLIDLEEEAP